MTKRTLSHAALWIALGTGCLLLTACQEEAAPDTGATASEGDPSGVALSGAGPRQVLQTDDGTCYVYPRYVVRATAQDTAPGQAVYVFQRDAEADARGPCSTPAADAYAAFDAEPRYFLGLEGDVLLLDEGTGPLRRLVAYDLRQHQPLYEGTYGEPVQMQDGMLVFFEEIDTTGVTAACPDAEAWTASGLSVAYEERVRLDLDTGTLSRTGDIRCAPRQ